MKSENDSGLIDKIQEVIFATWTAGVKSKRTDDPDYDFIAMSNQPWYAAFDSEESSISRLLVARIFEQMIRSGWMVS